MIMIPSVDDIKNDPKTAKTQLVIVTGLMLISWFFESDLIFFFTVSIALLCFIPAIGLRIVWFWYALAQVLGYINSRILLTLIYFLLITPIAFFFRLAGNDPLLLKDKRGSMFNFREHTYTKEDLENPW